MGWYSLLACCSPWSHRVRHSWANELNWTDYKWSYWLMPSLGKWALIHLLDSPLSCLWHYPLSWPEYSCVSTVLTPSLHSLPCLYQPVALGLEQWCWRISGPSWPYFLPASVAHSQLGDTQYMPKSMIFCPVRKMKPQTSARSLP